MHSEDDKTLVENNKKRTVKTPAQVEALEKFYNEHKYPKHSMKAQFAESIGLTEKQVSGWFCHRRLHDKRLLNVENCAVKGQDSSGSAKQGENRNLDTRQVENGNYNDHIDDASSGSSSSLPNVSNRSNEDPFDVATSRHSIPKFPLNVNGVKTKCGPSGFLKLKGRVENEAITAVKRQLGKHYRGDGPSLGVAFDSLPPGAFEYSMQDPYAGEAVASKVHQHPKSRKGSENASRNSNMDGTRFRTIHRHESDIPDNYSHQKFSHQEALLAYNGAYYPRRHYYPVESSQSFTKDIVRGSENRYDYVERVGSVLSHSLYERPPGKTYAEQRIINESRVNLPFKNDTTAPKRLRDEFPQLQQRVKRSSNPPGSY
ncbi:hypothetical protein ACJIZ3_012049 [Penstemon smallii]|uniref:Homeobox domain-containing protein n=1 Tax=Penstemon smallii TaxID=265156 RepID=A0ABD3UM47_9LAMI